MRYNAIVQFQHHNLVQYVPKSAGLFLIGLASFESGWVQKMRGKKLRGLLVVSVLALLTVGLWLFGQWITKNQLLGPEPQDRALHFLLNITEETMWSACYVVLFLLIFQNWNWLRRLLSYPGKMALTNYLMQTVICLFVFAGFGLGYYGKLETGVLIVIALSIYGFQLLLSFFWFQYVESGPLEYLWKKASRRISHRDSK
ncbi:MAG: DUF418 domain-containing protein [Flavobacteriales bacterium]|nr:DUF418 domain-containing protein [Flavobacteriales bacterium]